MKWYQLFIVCNLLISCSTNTLDYKDIDSFHFIKWDGIFNISEYGYFYFYSYTCSACNRIKEEVLNFLIHQEIYFLIIKSDDFQYCHDDKISIGVNNIHDFRIEGTPTLMYLEKSKVNKILCGYVQIFNHINNSSI